VAWYGKKVNQTQQKHTFINQKKSTATQNKHKKLKARFSRLLRHPAWKQRGPILILELHKFVTYLLTQTLTQLLAAPWGSLRVYLQSQDPHGALSPTDLELNF